MFYFLSVTDKMTETKFELNLRREFWAWKSFQVIISGISSPVSPPTDVLKQQVMEWISYPILS